LEPSHQQFEVVRRSVLVDGTEEATSVHAPICVP
jgi:hypothetical protein